MPTTIIPMLSVLVLIVPGWNMTAASASPTVTQLVQDVSIQVNGTNGAINVSSGSTNVNFYHSIYGDVGGSPSGPPPWPTWLNPITSTTESKTLAWPTVLNQQIFPGETYRRYYKKNYESGHHTWTYYVDSPDGLLPYTSARRDRAWHAYVTDDYEITGP